MSTSPPVRTRHAQRAEALCAASLRALCGERTLHFRGRHLWRGASRLPAGAPHLSPSFEHDAFGALRGVADGWALRLRESDALLHARCRPTDAVAGLLFDLLEQYRAESLAAWPGLLRNLRQRHEQWSLDFHDAGLTGSSTGLLLYTVAQVCRARVTAQPVVEATEGLIEATRMAIAPLLGAELARLRRERLHQAAYARHARAIAEAVAERVAHDEAAEARERPVREARPQALSLWLDPAGDGDTGFATAAAGHSPVLQAAAAGYRVFTTAHDRELQAGSLVRAALLKELRDRLDRRIAAAGLNVGRLAHELKALLATPQHDGWDGAQESGRIDGRQLARLVATPAERRLFRSERLQPVADVVVGFLVDCSGSMKQHVESVALLVDVFVRALDRAGVASEVLGFTTGAWNGGRAQRDWQRAGRPRHPGRLNELCHLVFKQANTPWGRARQDIAALLKADLFREGVDGEAVAWACGRLRATGAGRRLLVVVSDGSPMDRATELANDAHYLGQHLREVVDLAERRGDAEIFGLGVGLDLSPYYPRSRVLDLSQPLGGAAVRDVLSLLAGRPSFKP